MADKSCITCNQTHNSSWFRIHPELNDEGGPIKFPDTDKESEDECIICFLIHVIDRGVTYYTKDGGTVYPETLDHIGKDYCGSVIYRYYLHHEISDADRDKISNAFLAMNEQKFKEICGERADDQIQWYSGDNSSATTKK